ncbi:MAG: carbohydrate-binding family 9-like protein [Pyrinomonadaceae bacterium]
MPSNANDPIEVRYIESDFAIAELDNKFWRRATETAIGTFWSGKASPAGRHFSVRLLWSDTALYVRFSARQDEPLVVSNQPDISKKTVGLWERDVCEIFIAPDKTKPNKYYEFEIAPTGEWIDLGIEVTPNERRTDWEYRSGMTSSSRIEKKKVVMAIKIPFASLGKIPKADDIWLGNLFRCVGKGPRRGYLAWRPTKTKEPNFHVPKAFGEFKFTK